MIASWCRPDHSARRHHGGWLAAGQLSADAEPVRSWHPAEPRRQEDPDAHRACPNPRDCQPQSIRRYLGGEFCCQIGQQGTPIRHSGASGTLSAQRITRHPGSPKWAAYEVRGHDVMRPPARAAPAPEHRHIGRAVPAQCRRDGQGGDDLRRVVYRPRRHLIGPLTLGSTGRSTRDGATAPEVAGSRPRRSANPLAP